MTMGGTNLYFMKMRVPVEARFMAVEARTQYHIHV